LALNALECGNESGGQVCGRLRGGVPRATAVGAFRLEWLMMGWMTTEAVVALVAGIGAGSLVLVAFGLDSVIELISAGVLMWRLSTELRHGQAFSEGCRTACESDWRRFVVRARDVRSACGGLESPGSVWPRGFPWPDSFSRFWRSRLWTNWVAPHCGLTPSNQSRVVGYP
jgi:hypothetical protein